MKRKLFAMLTALVLLLNQLPFGVLAADAVCSQPEICVDGSHVEGCDLYVAPETPTTEPETATVPVAATTAPPRRD